MTTTAVASAPEPDRRYLRYVQSTEDYVAAIEAAGDQPWWLNPAKLARLEQHMPGISDMQPDQRREALFNRNRRKETTS